MSRKAKWPPPIYHRRGRSFARVWSDGKPHDYPLGPEGSDQSREAYARLVAEMTANGGKPPAPATGSDATLHVVAARWLEWRATACQTDGEVTQCALAVRALLRLYGSTPARDFDAEKLRTVQQAMLAGSWMTEDDREWHRRHRWPVGLCRFTTNHRLARLKAMFRWAEEAKLVPPGTYARLLVVKGVRKRTRGVREPARRKPTRREDLDAVLPHCKPVVAAMLEVQWLAGMRSCEVRKMRGRDIDRADPECWLYRPSDAEGRPDHKTAHLDPGDDAPRVVPLNRACQAVLLPWLAKAAPEDFLFKTVRGRPFSTKRYPEEVQRACRLASIAATRDLGLTVRERFGRIGAIKFQPYCNRHAAKQRITREYGLDAARAFLGQRSLQSTASYAAAVDLEHAIETAKKLA